MLWIPGVLCSHHTLYDSTHKGIMMVRTARYQHRAFMRHTQFIYGKKQHREWGMVLLYDSCFAIYWNLFSKIYPPFLYFQWQISTKTSWLTSWWSSDTSLSLRAGQYCHGHIPAISPNLWLSSDMDNTQEDFQYSPAVNGIHCNGMECWLAWI